jgi:carboxylesterase
MQSSVGILLIHGFGGSINEVAPLAAKLQQAGYMVACPTLKGHGGSPADMKSVTYQQWVASAEEEMEQIKGCDKIFFIGFSMGGLIALQLALKHNPAAIATINTPVYYWSVRQILSNIYHDIRSSTWHNIKRYTKAGNSLPFSAMWQFRQLLIATKKQLHRIHQPILIKQCKDDDTVQKKSASYLFHHISSVDKTLSWQPKGGHVVLLSPFAPKVITDITTFIHSQSLTTE